MDTKRIIMQAAFELFSQKRFDDITIQDILNRAKCSRYTFYRYYQDKYELMRLYYTSVVTKFVLEDYNGNNFEEIQERIFQFVLDNRGYFESVKDIKGNESFWSFLISYTHTFFSSVKKLNTNRDFLSAEEDYEMMFVVNGGVSLFKKYVNERENRLSPAQISRLLCGHYPKEYYMLPREKLEEFTSTYKEALSKVR